MPPDVTPVSLELRESITELFASRVADGHAPGSYFAIFGPDQVEFEHGFGQRNQDGNEPDAGTFFRIASCTKSFTAAVLLILRDRGMLDLDSLITEFVPVLRDTVPVATPFAPTVRMLMTMSGGLPTDDPWGDRQESLAKAELDSILRRGLAFIWPPGTGFEYSNLGYALLGQVIETVTGSDYIDVVRAEVLAPLGLNSTVYDRRQISSDNVAVGYRKRADEWLQLPFSGPGAFSAIGGIFSTPRDMAKWASWLAGALRPDAAETGPLSVASRREMQQIHRSFAPILKVVTAPDGPAPEQIGYGFGLFVEDSASTGQSVFHPGGYPGFSSYMRWSAAAQLGIVAFENATYSGVSLPAIQALGSVLDQGRVPVPTATPWPETVELGIRAEGLLHKWDEGVVQEIFTPNVALDLPLAERADGIMHALQLVGGLDTSAEGTLGDARSDTPAHLVWYVPGSAGRVRCEIQLTPTRPLLVQSFQVTAQPR